MIDYKPDRRPLAIDLYAGLGGWAEGLLAEGYRVVGFDNKRHVYYTPKFPDETGDGNKGTKPVEKRGWTAGTAISLGLEGSNKQRRDRIIKYPSDLVLQDVLTLHGSQFRDAALIVASPPCQEFSKRAMPFKDGKAQTPKSLGLPTPAWWSKMELPKRFKRAEDALGAYAFGRVMNPSEMREWTAWKKQYPVKPPDRRLFDACFRIQREAIAVRMRDCRVCIDLPCANCYIPLIVENVRGAQPWVGRSAWNYGSFHLWGDVPALMPITLRRTVMKRGVTHRSDGATNFHGLDGIKQLHSRSNNQTAGRHRMGLGDGDGQKVPAYSDPRRNGGKGVHLTSPQENAGGTKIGGDWLSDPQSTCRKHGSRSNARKAASALIAKIPFELARHIAAAYHPRTLPNKPEVV